MYQKSKRPMKTAKGIICLVSVVVLSLQSNVIKLYKLIECKSLKSK